MKNLLLSFFALSLTFVINAQCDSTLANWDPLTHGATTGVYVWSGGNGYIMGQNAYGDNGWADKITYSGSNEILTDVIFFFGKMSGTGNINYKVWGDNAGVPDNGNVMTLSSIPISNLDTISVWSLATPIALSGDFYIGFDHDALVAGDTVALMSSSTGTNTMFSNETAGWIDLSAYSLDHGAAIIPVVCNINTGEKEILGEVHEVTVFPNPSIGTFNVALTSKAEVAIEVYNVLGEIIYNNTINSQLITIDVKDQPNGIYYVNISTGNSITTKKLILSK